MPQHHQHFVRRSPNKAYNVWFPRVIRPNISACTNIVVGCGVGEDGELSPHKWCILCPQPQFVHCSPDRLLLCVGADVTDVSACPKMLWVVVCCRSKRNPNGLTGQHHQNIFPMPNNLLAIRVGETSPLVRDALTNCGYHLGGRQTAPRRGLLGEEIRSAITRRWISQKEVMITPDTYLFWRDPIVDLTYPSEPWTG